MNLICVKRYDQKCYVISTKIISRIVFKLLSLWIIQSFGYLGLTCVTVIDFLLFLQIVLQPELLVGSRVFLHEIRYQNRLQQAEQHHSKNHNAVGR